MSTTMQMYELDGEAEYERKAHLDGPYRYSLSRRWDWQLGFLGFVMLNPSKADALIDDPTIRRCVGFARALGYGGIQVANVFAYRATNPDELSKAVDPIGDKNDEALRSIMFQSSTVIAAWGSKVPVQHKAHLEHVKKLLRDLITQYQYSVSKLHVLKLNSDGNPGHPLYLKGNLRPFPWMEDSK